MVTIKKWNENKKVHFSEVFSFSPENTSTNQNFGALPMFDSRFYTFEQNLGSFDAKTWEKS